MDKEEEINEYIKKDDLIELEENKEDNKKFVNINEVENDIVIEDLEQEIKNDSLDYLKSNKTWSDLKIDKKLEERLISKGFKKPSKIQSSVISMFSKSYQKDLIVQSQNGSGKTLSFLIPSILTVLKESNIENKKNILAPEVIILGDTKELTYQIFKILLAIKTSNIRVDLQHPENNEFRLDSNIIVCTLGRLIFLLNKKILSTQNLKLFVIDEADKLLESDSNRNKIPIIFKNLTIQSRIAIFSATMPTKCIKFLEKLKRNLVKIILKEKQDLKLDNISHFFVNCGRKDKFKFINNLLYLLTEGSVIIFVNTKKFAENFAISLNKAGHKVDILLGDMETRQRLKVLDDFKNGKIRILVSTNLISRGIDNRKVGLVINLDLPYLNSSMKDGIKKIDCDTYIHRVGRTGRFGDHGIGLNIIEDQETRNELMILQTSYGLNLEEIEFDKLDKLKSKIEQNKTFNVEKRKLLEENI